MAQLALPQDDLVPLSVAASLAYCELIGVNSPLGSDEHLRDVLDLTAAALLHVAPAYRISPDGASLIRAEETEKLLLATIREGKQAPDVDGFYLRRGDLRAAIGKLRRFSPVVDFVPAERARTLVRVEPVVFAEIMGEGIDQKALEVHVMRPGRDGAYEEERDDTGPVAGENVQGLVARIAAAHGCRYATICLAEDRWPPAWASEARKS